MYQEMDAAVLRGMLRIEEADLPDALLIVGEFRTARALERFGSYFDSPKRHRGSDGWLVERHGRRYAIEVAFGAAMAGHLVHLWCGAGVGTVVQLGWFGALQPGLAAGDVLVPTHAAREEGVSDWYLPKGILAGASADLASGIAGRLRDLPGDVIEGPIFTTPSMLAESREVIADWGRHGWQGVDMETAATFAVARHFEAERAAALILVDDLVSETNLFPITSREVLDALHEREREVLFAVLEVLADRRGS